MRMQIDALIFDMDGVLADTEPFHIRSWELTMERVSPAIMATNDSRRTFRTTRERLTGMSSADIGRALIRLYGLPLDVEELLLLKRGFFRGMIAEDIVLFPGLRDELGRWTELPKALATSSSRAEAQFMIAHLGIADLFDPIVTSDDVKSAKPAPDCYLLAAERLGRKPSDCVVIEDSGHGIRAGLAAGARVLAVEAAVPAGEIDGVTAVFPSTVEALQWLRS
jgi:HAD superfamily hydrolase (TIGR01509 family)